MIIDRSLEWQRIYRDLAQSMELSIEVYDTPPALFRLPPNQGTACLISDTLWYSDPVSDSPITLMQHLESINVHWAVIFHCDCQDIEQIVAAMEAGAITVRCKPTLTPGVILDQSFQTNLTALKHYLTYALDTQRRNEELRTLHEEIEQTVQSLSVRQRTVLNQVVAGIPTKLIAKQLDVSQRLVEKERSFIIRQFGVESTPQVCTKVGGYQILRMINSQKSEPL